MIGGATTSRAHTAVKIAPEYSSTVVHVNDASRAVNVAESLINPKLKDSYSVLIKNEYEKLRDAYLKRSKAKEFLTILEARNNKLKLDWDHYEPAQPKFLGIKKINIAISELVAYIDWTPFFRSWELHGKYPNILQDEMVGKEASELFREAQKMLKELIAQNWLRAEGIFGIFPANQINEDDIEVYDEDGNRLSIFLTLRQQSKKTKGAPNMALADFVAPAATGKKDYIGAFCVTTGFGVDEIAKKYVENHDDYSSIMIKALADRLAEAFAEYLHEKVRKELWGYAPDEDLGMSDLFSVKMS